MSTVTLLPFPVNQTSSFIETLTDCDNFAHGNCSGEEEELQRKSTPSFDLWTDFEAYRYGYWTIVLFVVLLGIIGNSLLFVMMGDKQLNSLSYSVYLKFLAISDSLVLIINLINKSEATFLENRPTQVFLCVVSISVRVLVTILSPWLVVGLTLDRCVCVCFPLSRERFCTRKKAMSVCFTMLGLSLVLVVPFSVGTEVVNDKTYSKQHAE
ncbi:cysteinyl leukotriene receptor 1-like [Gigantopelta aegis]|uniref:cysteinyl leukotriene receptor 1-like n=1 Tax=Gigantopelta aegis TaxID=1735272 RepID=UPI001B88AAB6|nr:cysteinyl leukotriene receptor 1-like [Gigantopelta aegis]